MAPKCDLSGKDAPPGKKLTRKSVAATRNMLNLPERTLLTIRKGSEKITAVFKAGAGSVSTRVSSGQSTFMVCLEKMMVTWIDHRKRQGLNVTFDDTEAKAMECHHHLKAKETDPAPDFVASMGWFYNFKARYAFHNVKCSGEAKSTDTDAAALYLNELREIIEEEGYKPQQVFSVDETGL